MTRKGKKWRICRRKIRHLHYLTALLHARRLPHDNLVIYPCPYCQHLHVGRSNKKTKVFVMWERKKARLERRIACVQQQLAQLQHNLQQMLAAGPPAPDSEEETRSQDAGTGVSKR